MKIFQKIIKDKKVIESLTLDFNPDVILLFVSLTYQEIEVSIDAIQKKFPNTLLIGGTTAGEIIDQQVVDDSIVMSAIKFDKTKIKVFSAELPEDVSTYKEVGKQFVRDIEQEDLKHLFILSDVQTLNASNLLKGINNQLDSKVSVTGGLAGRESYLGSNFIIDNGELVHNRVVALAMYGDNLQVSYNAQGGWDSYGVECLVTKSENNHILEIDGQSALDFYRSHVGIGVLSNINKHGFKHPIKIRNEEYTNPVIRALLDVNEEKQSLIMAEEIPKGTYVRIMKANIDRLIIGAENAAKTIAEQNNFNHELAILISCSGRRKVLKDLASEEVEAVTDQFPETTKAIGFYSYGEISPFFELPKTSLHNLTMCVTTFSEL